MGHYTREAMDQKTAWNGAKPGRLVYAWSLNLRSTKDPD